MTSAEDLAAPADPLRVVVAASFTSTSAGGEAIIPWHYFVGLRRRGIDAQLVTRARTRDELLALEPALAAHMRFVADGRLTRVLEVIADRLPLRIRSITLWPLMGLLIEGDIRREAIGLAAGTAAVIHQPVPVSPRAASRLTGGGAPVVIGPLNGGMSYPPGFVGAVGRDERVTRWLVRAASDLVNRVLRGKPEAALLLVANERTAAALPKAARGVRVDRLVENGVDLELFPYREREGGRRRFAWVGRMVDWKRVDLLLDALARTPPDYRLELCGDGPLRAALQQQARQLGLADRVTFHGFVSQSACAEVLAGCDALLLPSIYECGGAVVLEAMASGLPVVATDWGGPADYVGPDTGILVPPTSPEGVTDGFAAAMRQLGEDGPLARRLGRAGRDRVERHYSWERKIDAILASYASCR